MRRFIPLGAALCLALLAGCSSNNKGILEGTKWTSLETSINDEKLPAGSATLEFKADGPIGSSDGSFVYTIKDNKYRGKYSLSRGNTVVFRFDQELAGRKVHTEKIIVDGDRLTMTDTGGTEIPFRRLEEAARE